MDAIIAVISDGVAVCFSPLKHLRKKTVEKSGKIRSFMSQTVMAKTSDRFILKQKEEFQAVGQLHKRGIAIFLKVQFLGEFLKDQKVRL